MRLPDLQGDTIVGCETVATRSFINFTWSLKGCEHLDLRFSAKNFLASVVGFCLVLFLFGWFLSASYFTAHLDESQKELDARVERLADAMLRVRNYESQLRMRASLLSDVLADVGKLDLHGFDASLSSGAGSAAYSKNQLSKGGPEFDATKGKLTKEEDSGLKSSGLGIGGGSVSDLFRGKNPLKIGQSDVDLDTVEGRLFLRSFDRQIDRLSALPIGSPVDGEVSSVFGSRKSPFTHKVQFHSGIDFAVVKRSIVVSSGDGKIVSSGALGGYGQAVVIDHGDEVQSLYGHLDEIVIEDGAKVCRGQVIGYLGSTGMSTGPHLHYEVRVGGIPRDPRNFVELAALLQILG